MNGSDDPRPDTKANRLSDRIDSIMYHLYRETDRTYTSEGRRDWMVEGIFLTLQLMVERHRITDGDIEKVRVLIDSWISPRKWWQFWK